jgi:hypothetical protein
LRDLRLAAPCLSDRRLQSCPGGGEIVLRLVDGGLGDEAAFRELLAARIFAFLDFDVGAGTADCRLSLRQRRLGNIDLGPALGDAAVTCPETSDPILNVLSALSFPLAETTRRTSPRSASTATYSYSGGDGTTTL